MKNKVYLGLGSNVGKRLSQLKKAAASLNRLPGTRLKKVSSVYETSPVGPRQRDYLNAVAQVETSLDPVRLLMQLQNLEKKLGRKNRGRWGPREIDLDMLFYGKRRMTGKTLSVPHPRWRDRKFVLEPLAQLSPRLRDPKSGRTVAHWRRKLTDRAQRIRLYKSSLL